MNAKELHQLIETITVMPYPAYANQNSHLTVTGLTKEQLAEILVLAELKLADDDFKARGITHPFGFPYDIHAPSS